jgi:hypothetical protein
MLSNRDVLELCASMLQRAGIDADALARHMAGPQVLLKHEHARIMLARPGGACSAEIEAELGISRSRVSEVLERLRQDVEVHRVVINGKLPVRHFLRQEHADAYRASAQAELQAAASVAAAPAPKPAIKRVKEGKPGHLLVVKGGTASPPAPAPAAAREVVVPANVRRTFVPAPPGRFELPADAQLTGGFSTTRPGMNPLTGKAWGA